MLMLKNVNLVTFETLWCLATKVKKNESQLDLLLYMLIVIKSNQSNFKLSGFIQKTAPCISAVSTNLMFC